MICNSEPACLRLNVHLACHKNIPAIIVFICENDTFDENCEYTKQYYMYHQIHWTLQNQRATTMKNVVL